MSGFFDALKDNDSSSENSETSISSSPVLAEEISASSSVVRKPVHIPSYENLSVSRADEETVLQAVYGDEEYRREVGLSGLPRLEVDVRPPDVSPERVGSKLW